MKRTPTLCKQHIGWRLKLYWASNSKRKVQETKAASILAQKGIPVYKPEDILEEKHERLNLNIVGVKPKPIVFDKTHPLWHDSPILMYKDNNVLLEGLRQAKILTRTVEVKDGLPSSILSRKDLADSIFMKTHKEIDERVKEIILSSHVFDAEQQKLPKIKDPKRPGVNFPRIYGITQDRATKLLMSNLWPLVVHTSDPSLIKERYLKEDLFFTYNFTRFGDQIQFKLKGDALLSSTKPLSPVSVENVGSLDLPDIFPVKPTITLFPENIYEASNFYPIRKDTPKVHPHTVFVYHNEQEVKNLYEENVTDEQLFGRSLLKAFTVAASYAKQLHGDESGDLPKPVTVQCIHTNGRLFHFGVLQLNTLDLESSNLKNVWYQSGRIPLFDVCAYIKGRPTLEGYNNDVVKLMRAFYNNV